MRMRLLLCLVCCVACAGSGDDEPPSAAEQLKGRWILPSSNGDPCAALLEFFDDATYEHDAVCELEGGALGVQTELGTYEATDNRVTFTPTHESCPAANSNIDDVAFGFLDDGRLRFVRPDGAVVYAPNKPQAKSANASNAGAVIEYGCWSGDLFERHAIEKL